MEDVRPQTNRRHVVPRKGDVDRNPADEAGTNALTMSSPARGTWIEIHAAPPLQVLRDVVPRKGDVDRNEFNASTSQEPKVVPRKGDVDRNGSRWLTYHYPFWSSPARGTWIEI